MKAHISKNQRGVTLVELIVAMGILVIVIVATLGIFVSMLDIWAQGSGGTNANSYAAICMRKLVLDVQEGTSATASVDGNSLTVTFPFLASATADYNRGRPGKVVTYYLSGRTGTETTGELKYLWKSVDGGKTLFARNVKRVTVDKPPFTVTNKRLIRIDIKGEEVEGNTISPNEIQQSVRLRNS